MDDELESRFPKTARSAEKGRGVIDCCCACTHWALIVGVSLVHVALDVQAALSCK